MPIVLRETSVGGEHPVLDKVLSEKRVLDRRYVEPKKVKPTDIVLTTTPQDVQFPEDKEGKLRRVALSPKELLDPRIRAEVGLPAPEVDEDDEGEPRARRTREQEEDEELDEEEIEADEEPEGLEAFVSDWKAAVEMIGAAAEDQDTELLAELHAAEMRRTKPRPSVVKAFAEAGLGEAGDFRK